MAPKPALPKGKAQGKAQEVNRERPKRSFEQILTPLQRASLKNVEKNISDLDGYATGVLFRQCVRNSFFAFPEMGTENHFTPYL